MIERLLLHIAEEEESLQRQMLLRKFQEENQLPFKEKAQSESHFWPPWPWPPWGDDEKPTNQTERAHKLAKQVLQFESEIANASLDLLVFLYRTLALV